VLTHAQPAVSQLQYSYGIGHMDVPTKLESIDFFKDH
jgi:hypothetical protein